LVIYGKINKDLEKRFRLKAVDKYPGEKGALIKALEEAIRFWLRET
jgi:hypothetical protein